MFDCVRYAQKANSNTHILRLLRSMGVVTDAVSLGEIERALRAGYVPGTSAHEIVFTADIIDKTTLARVLELGIPVNCGSPDMVRQVGRAGRGHPVWLRINPGFGHGHNRKTNTGGPSSKHGIWHEEFEDSLGLVDEYGLSLIGLHMHIGSGVDYDHLHRVCESMLDAVRRANRPLQAISAGGGLSVPYRSGEPEIDIAAYHAAWNTTRLEAERITGSRMRLELEPGRYLVGNAGLLVAEIRAVKKVADKHFVLVDAGFNDLARPIIYGSHHEICFVTQAGSPVTGPTFPLPSRGRSARRATSSPSMMAALSSSAISRCPRLATSRSCATRALMARACPRTTTRGRSRPRSCSMPERSPSFASVSRSSNCSIWKLMAWCSLRLGSARHSRSMRCP